MDIYIQLNTGESPLVSYNWAAEKDFGSPSVGIVHISSRDHAEGVSPPLAFGSLNMAQRSTGQRSLVQQVVSPLNGLK